MKIAPLGGQTHDGARADELLRSPAILDEVGDRDHLEGVLPAVRDQVGHAGHRAVLVHDLADDPGRVEAGEAGKIDRRFGLTRSFEHPAGAGPQREDVPGLHEVFRACAGVDGHLDGAGPVGRGDPRGHALTGLDGDGERGLETGLVGRGPSGAVPACRRAAG